MSLRHRPIEQQQVDCARSVPLDGQNEGRVWANLDVNGQTSHCRHRENGRNSLRVHQIRVWSPSDSQGSLPGKLLSPTRRREAVSHVCEALAVSQRRACRMLGQVRRTQRYASILSDDETALATEYGRYGYRRITALLRADGWPVNHKRIERIWRQEGLKVPARQPKRGRLWLNDGIDTSVQ